MKLKIVLLKLGSEKLERLK